MTVANSTWKKTLLNQLQECIKAERQDVNINGFYFTEKYRNDPKLSYKTGLMVAVSSQLNNMAETLIKLGADVNVANSKGFTAIMYAAIHGNSAIMKPLLDAGAPLNSRSRSPILWAAHYGKVNAVSELIKRGADLNIPASHGYTALFYAARDGFPLPLVINLLINGADPNLKNMYGETPLYLAAYRRHPKIVATLIKNGADLNLQNRKIARYHAARLAYWDVVKELGN